MLFIILINVGPGVMNGLMQVLWGILDFEQPDTQTMNNIVISSVELIYSYAECLSLHGKDTAGHSVAPAVQLFKKLLFFPNEAVQASSRCFSHYIQYIYNSFMYNFFFFIARSSSSFFFF